jgi:hypothetical protein
VGSNGRLQSVRLEFTQLPLFDTNSWCYRKLLSLWAFQDTLAHSPLSSSTPPFSGASSDSSVSPPIPIVHYHNINFEKYCDSELRFSSFRPLLTPSFPVFLSLTPFTTSPFSDEVARLGAALELDCKMPILEELPAAINQHCHLLFLLSNQFTELYHMHDYIISQHDALQLAYVCHCSEGETQEMADSTLDQELFDGIDAFYAAEGDSLNSEAAVTTKDDA